MPTKTIQMQLRIHAESLSKPLSDVRDCMTEAASLIDELERYPRKSPEFLLYPWGGVVRKSEIRHAIRICGDVEDQLCIEIEYMTGRLLEDYAPDVDTAKTWLADIEGQLGVKR